ncbi:hypothetical protein E5345_02835 [Propionibacterium sp. NM47_B9-13]|nr:hypothetical protein HMPREF9621_01478 [Cutibacterium modestum HL037PA2]EFT15200.1 hypothetical protein HMPREF9622_01737 [Cutibacterium modestum HL037PA3]REB73797.1 hypothetical protein CP877_09670 [Cutibacterium modestum]TGY30204.1 hypothetical protein E5345_02835 [Propionibacterium sp. NM47_B9-13]
MTPDQAVALTQAPRRLLWGYRLELRPNIFRSSSRRREDRCRERSSHGDHNDASLHGISPHVMLSSGIVPTAETDQPKQIGSHLHP